MRIQRILKDKLKNKHKLKLKRKDRLSLFNLALGIVFILYTNVIDLVPGKTRSIYYQVVRPIHDFMADFCDHFSFSLAELLIGIFAIGLIVEIIRTAFKIVLKGKLVTRFLSLLLLVISDVCLIYGGFCILWGVYYSASDVSEICGVSSTGVKHEDLIQVDEFFVQLANEYSSQVNRDADGCTVFSDEVIFENAYHLYDNIEEVFPGLKATPHRPKPVHFSEIVSYMDFTGFFFPFTAEANINVHSPDSMIPATIAHELAHQRGIAAEDEANFIAVVSCMESEDPEYIYSASLLALIHLQNALYKSGDKDAWNKIKDSYSEGVINDLNQNSNYWTKYRKSKVYKASNGTYDAFLKSYKQTLGTETYGACVDLLVEYYHI